MPWMPKKAISAVIFEPARAEIFEGWAKNGRCLLTCDLQKHIFNHVWIWDMLWHAAYISDLWPNNVFDADNLVA